MKNEESRGANSLTVLTTEYISLLEMKQGQCIVTGKPSSVCVLRLVYELLTLTVRFVSQQA
jgi:hypothetical protein